METDPKAARLSLATTGLIQRDGEAVVLASRHHDLTATIPYEPQLLRDAAAIVARERGEDPNEYNAVDDLVFAVDLFERCWPWADFGIGRTTPDALGRHRLYCTAKANPPADTGPPRHLARTHQGDGTLTGNAIYLEIDHQPDLGHRCGTVAARRNRQGKIDRLRNQAAAGDDGYLLARR